MAPANEAPKHQVARLMLITRPRSSGGQVSATSIDPSDHSPFIAKVLSARHDEDREAGRGSLLKRPNETFAMTARAWRRAGGTIQGWPQVSVSIPDRRRQWVFRWDRFPSSLSQDCQTWCDRLAGR